ncbi:helicase DnaB [Lentilactobacillus sp. G22-6]|uniref:DnaB-like helicase C-terminal domain-containing protein n=1 Tax=Lentilactobacillus dabitei TaxID=2831523 RepID=UPI001C25C002|nr:DnaB-like helicase C-terminal domain-containing protein [Lentilactobacillus dabitei]MBU9788927.1 helicase DnaB [Lentilactobacillus dabitei]
MQTNQVIPDIERKAMWFLINQPQVLNSETVDEKWFSNNSYRILASYINMWAGQYDNADQIAAAFGDTPFGKKLNVQGIFKSIQSVRIPTDAHGTFQQLRQEFYKAEIKSAAMNVFKDPSSFNMDHLDELRNQANQKDDATDNESYKMADDALRELESPQAHFLKTYPDLDNLLGGGLTANQLMIIGARPSVGKTAFALNLGMNAILQNPNLTVEIFSLEMSSKQNMRRVYSSMSNIPLNFWKNPAVRMSADQKKQAADTIKQIAQLHFWSNDRLISIDDIASVIKQHAQRLGSGNYLPIVDHIGLVATDNPKQDTRQALEEVSRRLKILTQTLKIPLIALSQLNRGVESRQSNEPFLSDLRETGTIEQDANIVGFLWRPSDDPDDQNLNLSIKKNRDGSLGKIEFYFQKNVQKIVEVNKHAETVHE